MPGPETRHRSEHCHGGKTAECRAMNFREIVDEIASQADSFLAGAASLQLVAGEIGDVVVILRCVKERFFLRMCAFVTIGPQRRGQNSDENERPTDAPSA